MTPRFRSDALRRLARRRLAPLRQALRYPARLSRRALATLRLGARGERAARRYLRASGYSIVAVNWRCRRGELDIVARHGHELVFVEVKSRVRAPGSPFSAFERIDEQKQSRLVALSKTFAAGFPGADDLYWRYDTIAVHLERVAGLPIYRRRILHRKAAFE